MSEKISALIDEVVDENCLPELIEELCEDPLLQERWQRYHLIRSAIRGECTTAYFESVYGVSEEEADTDAPSLFAFRRQRKVNVGWVHDLRERWGSWVNGFGLAAALSAAAVFGFISSSIFDTQLSDPQKSYTESFYVGNDALVWQAHSNQDTHEIVNANYLNETLLAHNDFTGLYSINGLSNYARMVSYDN